MSWKGHDGVCAEMRTILLRRELEKKGRSSFYAKEVREMRRGRDCTGPAQETK